ncbi:MAG: hypothetical protein JSS42_10515 [Proteobacteria bacterium]|uniref:hypothetical protein n=1 Tax=Rudaea sp. TaxID=2136325 RepID=UPI0032202CA7|nr:hypothetical protein [Pseudomonadota bacterium]
MKKRILCALSFAICLGQSYATAQLAPPDSEFSESDIWKIAEPDASGFCFPSQDGGWHQICCIVFVEEGQVFCSEGGAASKDNGIRLTPFT